MTRASKRGQLRGNSMLTASAIRRLERRGYAAIEESKALRARATKLIRQARKAILKAVL
jgi:hypothetical protein